MALTNAFYEAVSSGLIRRVRIMMKDSLLVDPTFAEFEDMEKEASKLNGLYDKHDGRPFNKNKETWDDEYMNELMVEVIDNFSHERIEHLKEVVRYLRPITEETIKTQKLDSRDKNNNYKKQTRYQEQKYRDQIDGNYRGSKIAMGAVVGAVVGGVTASIIGITAVGGTFVGAVAGGVGVAAGRAIKNTKRKERH